MRILLVCGLIMAVSFSANAQKSFSYKNGKNFNSYILTNGDQDCKIYIKNITSNSVKLVFRKIAASEVSGWAYQLCDNIACFPSLVEKDSSALISANEEINLKITVAPNGIAGTTTASYEVYANNKPQEKDTLTWTIINAWGASNTHLQFNPLNVYPNPAADYIYFSLPFSAIQIVDIHGKKVMELTQVSAKQQFSIAQLSAGIYTIQAINSEGKPFQAKLIKK